MATHQTSGNSLEYYRELFDSCASGYIVTDSEGVIYEVNRTLAELLQREKTYFPSRNLSEFIAQTDLELFRTRLGEMKRHQLVLGLKLPEGRTSRFRTTVDALPDAVGGTQRVQWLLQPLDDGELELEQARREEERYRSLVELSPQPIWVQGNGEIIYCNEAVAQLLGATDKADLVAKPISEIIHPDFHEVAEQRVQRVLEKNDVASPLEEKLIRLDGNVLDVEVVSSRISYQGRFAVRVVIQDITRRKQSELALRASEERFRIFMDNTPTPVFIKDEEGRYVYLNKAIEKLVGTPVKELLGKSIYSRLPEEISQPLVSNDAQVLATGQSQQFQETIVAADGTRRTQIVIKFPLHNNSEKGLVAGIAVDITERVQAEEALKASERRLQSVIFNLPVLLLVIDRDAVITIAEGKGLLSLPHFNRNQAGKTIWECYRDSPQILEEMLRGLKGETFNSELSIGGRILDVFVTPLQDGERGTNGCIVVAMDITERRRAEKERDELLVTAQTERLTAEASREHFVNILDSITDGFFALDREWNFIYVNSRFEEICSRSREEMVGHSIWEQFPEVLTTEFYEKYRHAMQERTTVEFEAYYPAFEAWYAARVYPAPEGLSVFILDITARKQAETTRHDLLMRLTTAQEEERWRIARDLHDQLGQDLAVLMLGLKALPRYAPLVPDAQSCVIELQSTVVHLMRQVRHVALNLRSEALGAFGLPTALQRYAEDWSHHHGIPVTIHSWGFEGRRVAPYIEATVYRIIQEAFTNVVRHANAEHVSVVLEYRDDYILAIVEDDGQGFDVEAVTNLSSAERGLGLQGMKERLALVNGTLQIESRNGEGTTIYVRLPAEGTTETRDGIE